jgi:hypothetical protein
LEKLGLEKGQDITQPLYLDPTVLSREETYRGITIENEEEIILVNPNKMVVKDLGVQTELNSKGIVELEDKIKKQAKRIEELEDEVTKNKEVRNKEIADLRAELAKEKG